MYIFVHVQSNRQNLVGTVVDTYRGYRNINLNLIGSGGFGKVYEFSDQRAVKEEFKVCYAHCSNVHINI